MKAVGSLLRLVVMFTGRMSSARPSSYSAVSRITGRARFFLQSYHQFNPPLHSPFCSTKAVSVFVTSDSMMDEWSLAEFRFRWQDRVLTSSSPGGLCAG